MLKDWIQALNSTVKDWRKVLNSTVRDWMKVLNSKDWTKALTRMVKDWTEALKKGTAWLAGNSPLPDRRSKAMIAGTLAFVAVLLVGLVVLGSSTKTPRRAAAPGISYGLGLSPVTPTTTTTTIATPSSAPSAAPATAKTAGKTASYRVAHHRQGGRRAAAALTATHWYTVRVTTWTQRNGRAHQHTHRSSTHSHRAARVLLRGG
jgi:hypothetical protein